jgi:hypothetical protein
MKGGDANDAASIHSCVFMPPDDLLTHPTVAPATAICFNHA